ncbi:hypothetical protein N7474_005821 [Penicillium riverlandense]|uniref:uncharacterized protein n=1 Tax=Penicillium riverlandense TaxID=1903569 RepID=UPI002547C6AA|nr:uncharacterized protein N7474_005821 [Penicillium riverlandense]KAJ5820230.1 hypothetical protein N7474_005821 [Penicillium riverlandense]
MVKTSFPGASRRTVALALNLLAGLSLGDDFSLRSALPPSIRGLTSVTEEPSVNTWIIPLSGPGNDISSAWGANVTTNSNSSPRLIPPTISNDTQNGVRSSLFGYTATFINAESPASSHSNKFLEVNLADTKEPQLVLGQNSLLGSSDSTKELPTVPFGLNIGFAGEWNGSLSFGGIYDANRIYGQTGWESIPEANDTKSTFLTTGNLAVDSVTVRSWQYNGDEGDSGSSAWYTYPYSDSTADNIQYTVPGVLNFSSPSVVLPGKELCGKNLTLEFNTNSNMWQYTSFVIPIFADLTASSSRCSVNEDIGNTDSPPMVLGIPFFQATYIYVDSNTKIWFSSVNEWNMAFDPKPFNANGELTNPKIPASATQAAKTPTSTANGGGKVYSTGDFVAIVTMGLSLLLL